jgi:predicted MPP superfamily phosphohydrolase
MKLVTIGDIHGRNIWKQIVEQEQPTTVVFVGDYFDSFDIPGMDQINNFKNIIQWKLDNPQCKVVLLIGNHDFHYMSTCNEYYSGFQRDLYIPIGEVLETNKHHLQIAYRCDDLVFSHAGITPEFLLSNNWGEQDMVEFVNDLWLYKPHKFKFMDNKHGYSDLYGDDEFQGPLWIRPKSLMKACQDVKKTMIQVVGHTEVKEIDLGKATGGRYYFIDCLGTSQEYLVYENKQIKINKV